MGGHLDPDERPFDAAATALRAKGNIGPMAPGGTRLKCPPGPLLPANLVALNASHEPQAGPLTLGLSSLLTTA